MNRRHKPLAYGLGGLLVIWLAAWGGVRYFQHITVTADKVAAHMRSTDLGALSGEERAAALKELADMMNALAPDERRRARIGGDWERWFAAMTDLEKAGFIEATLPSGVKQMLTAFEGLEPEKRREAVERALHNLGRAREESGGGGERSGESGRGGELSPQVQEKIVAVGLKAFYSESSAQTKAELAPVLEEMQRLMEDGRFFRRGRGRRGD